MKEYSHFISLGERCYTANDLNALNLRETSSPFDWLITSWSGIEFALRSEFSDFLSFENMSQSQVHPGWYFDEKYQFEFRHDFSQFTPLKKQLRKVTKKHSRRIARFLSNIHEPTLFLRCVETVEECNYLAENYPQVSALIKSFCPDNDIIFISHHQEILSIPNSYLISPPSPGQEGPVHPLLSNETLLSLLQALPYCKRENNKEYAATHKLRSFRKKKLLRFSKNLKKRFLRPYDHPRKHPRSTQVS